MTSKEDFQAYVVVQRSGATNMFDTNTISDLSGLDRETIIDIMDNYAKYQKEYAITTA